MAWKVFRWIVTGLAVFSGIMCVIGVVDLIQDEWSGDLMFLISVAGYGSMSLIFWFVSGALDIVESEAEDKQVTKA